MIQKVSMNFAKNIAKKSSLIRNIDFSHSYHKLSRTLEKDSFELSQNVASNPKFMKLVQKSTDFIETLSPETIANSENKLSKLSNLAKLNSKIEGEEFSKKSKVLIEKAKKVISEPSFILTGHNFDEVEEIEKLNVNIMKKDGIPEEEIITTITERIDIIRGKAQSTVSKMRNNSNFYRQNVSSDLINMYNNDAINKVIYNSEFYVHGEQYANYHQNKMVKKQVINAIERNLNDKIDHLVSSLAKKLIDENLPQKSRIKKLIELQRKINANYRRI